MGRVYTSFSKGLLRINLKGISDRVLEDMVSTMEVREESHGIMKRLYVDAVLERIRRGKYRLN